MIKLATIIARETVIRMLTILGLSVALKTLQLMEGHDKPDLASTLAFTLAQLKCLKSLTPTLESRTKKPQNPYPPLSLPWATWLIARLGSASGYQSRRSPLVCLSRLLLKAVSGHLRWMEVSPILTCVYAVGVISKGGYF